MSDVIQLFEAVESQARTACRCGRPRQQFDEHQDQAVGPAVRMPELWRADLGRAPVASAPRFHKKWTARAGSSGESAKPRRSSPWRGRRSLGFSCGGA